MRRTLPLFALVGASALVLAGCAGGKGGTSDGSADAKYANGKTFTAVIAGDPGNLNPLVTAMSTARWMDSFLYGSLISVAEDGSVDTAFAEKWEADTKVATYTIRDGLTCEDGTPLTAKDIAENISWSGNPESKSPMIGMQIQAGTTAVGDNDKRTVTVTSSKPDPFLLINIGALPIVCGNVLHKPDVLAKGGGATGMFKMDDFTANTQYTMSLRKEFFAGPKDFDPKATGLPAKAVFRVVPNESTAVNLLLSGEVNMVSVNGPDRKRLDADKRITKGAYLSPIGQISYNQKDGRPTKDQAVRHALTSALDLDEVRKVLTGGEGKKATSFITVSPNPCREDGISAHIPKFDFAGAEAELDQAGWKKGSDGVRVKDGQRLELKVLSPTTLGESVTAGVELMRDTWTKLGVKVTMKAVDGNGLSDAYFNTGDWDIAPSPITLALPTQLVSFASGPVPPNGTNYAHIDNPEYNKAVAAAREKAGTAGCADWAAAEGALTERSDIITYATIPRTSYGKNATFTVSDGVVVTSIRMHQ